MERLKYILRGREIVRVDNLEEWARLFGDADRHVAAETIDEAQVSTVFLGVDHSFGSGPPLVFETLVFGGPHHGDVRRYSTYDEAEAGHREMVALVKGNVHGPN